MYFSTLVILVSIRQHPQINLFKFNLVAWPWMAGASTLTQVNTPHEALGVQAMGFFGHIQSSLRAFYSNIYQLIQGLLKSSSNF